MTTVPPCTSRYLTVTTTRCHQRQTHPIGSRLLVYDSVSAVIIQDSGGTVPTMLVGRTNSVILCLHTPPPPMCGGPAALAAKFLGKSQPQASLFRHAATSRTCYADPVH